MQSAHAAPHQLGSPRVAVTQPCGHRVPRTRQVPVCAKMQWPSQMTPLRAPHSVSSSQMDRQRPGESDPLRATVGRGKAEIRTSPSPWSPVSPHTLQPPVPSMEGQAQGRPLLGSCRSEQSGLQSRPSLVVQQGLALAL